MKKDNVKLLLISSMYPTLTKPSFGTFVKKTERLLEFNGIQTIDRVVLGKEEKLVLKIISYIVFYFNINKKIMSCKYDAIYVHYMLHPVLMLIPIFFFINKPIILNAHGSDITNTSFFSRVLRLLIRPVVKRSHLIVSPSDFLSRRIINEYKLSSNRVFVYPSGGVEPNKISNNSWREKNSLTIGYISRLEYGKGWDLILDAVAHLVNIKGISVRLIVAGNGSDKDKLITRIKELNLCDNVVVLGELKHKDVLSVYKKMDVFVFPSRYEESLGLVGLEAMSESVPVIGSGLGGMGAYLIDSYNGYKFDITDKSDLRKVLEKFYLLNKETMKVLRFNAYKTSLEFDSEKVTNELSQAIRRIFND